jgi:hypothetical protein
MDRKLTVRNVVLRLVEDLRLTLQNTGPDGVVTQI